MGVVKIWVCLQLSKIKVIVPFSYIPIREALLGAFTRAHLTYPPETFAELNQRPISVNEAVSFPVTAGVCSGMSASSRISQSSNNLHVGPAPRPPELSVGPLRQQQAWLAHQYLIGHAAANIVGLGW